MNGRGELIGLAFDGNWEAMSGDVNFEPKLQRTINVDARYVLFVIDKLANAQNLIAELDIRQGCNEHKCCKHEEGKQCDKACDKQDDKKQCDKACDKQDDKKQCDKACDKQDDKKQCDKACDKKK